MMELLKGIGFLVMMPILYVGGFLLMFVVARWMWMFIGVITGNKDVIQEFDCRDRKPWYKKSLEEHLLGKDQDKDFKNHDWRRRNRRRW
jgi:hypothetical protein